LALHDSSYSHAEWRDPWQDFFQNSDNDEAYDTGFKAGRLHVMETTGLLYVDKKKQLELHWALEDAQDECARHMRERADLEKDVADAEAEVNPRPSRVRVTEELVKRMRGLRGCLDNGANTSSQLTANTAKQILVGARHK
jgi:hypothetical protein